MTALQDVNRWGEGARGEGRHVAPADAPDVARLVVERIDEFSQEAEADGETDVGEAWAIIREARAALVAFRETVHPCGHSVCSQHYIDTGSRECAFLVELVGAARNAWQVWLEGELSKREAPKAQARLSNALCHFDGIEV